MLSAFLHGMGFAKPYNKGNRSGFARRFRPTYPDFLHGASPTSACAAFIEESRIKLSNVGQLDKESGVRCCERGHPSCSTKIATTLGRKKAPGLPGPLVS
jgi:hypothetical protein